MIIFISTIGLLTQCQPCSLSFRRAMEAVKSECKFISLLFLFGQINQLIFLPLLFIFLPVTQISAMCGLSSHTSNSDCKHQSINQLKKKKSKFRLLNLSSLAPRCMSLPLAFSIWLALMILLGPLCEAILLTELAENSNFEEVIFLVS